MEAVGRARLRPADELLAAQRGERGPDIGLGIVLAHQDRHRVAGELGVLLAVFRDDPGGLPQHFSQRPERDAIAVGQAAPPR